MPKAKSMNPLPFIFMFVFFHESNAAPHFRQAPKFYNSPECPPIPPSTSICSPSTVHIAMTLDAAYLRGSMAAILSLLHHSSCPQNIAFHFIASASDSDLRHLISASFPYLHFHVYHFDDSVVSYLISTSIRPALDRPLNYARSYLATLLPPCVRRIVYLDSDVIVIDDIAKLADTDFGFSAVIAAAEHCTANFTSFFTPAFWSNPTLSLTFSGRRACYFNTGVMVIDLDRWRAGQSTAMIEEWMELQKWMRIYELGSLPPFLLVFAGNIAAVDQRWNRNGLGRDDFSGQCPDMYPGPLSILHWSGKLKPWDRIDANRPCPLDSQWAPYDLYLTPLALTPNHHHHHHHHHHQNYVHKRYTSTITREA